MKNIIFCVVFMLCATLISHAQNDMKVLSVDTIKPVQTLYKPVPLSHWSFALKGGLNNFLISPPAVNYADRINFSGVAELEYTFNPFLGLGVEYCYSDYSRPYEYSGTIGSLDGSTHDVFLVGSVNLSNSISPFRQGFWKKVNVYSQVGAGLATYKGSLDGAVASSQSSLAGLLSLNVEYNLSKAMNLSLGGEYHQYDALNMTQGSRANRNGDALMLTLGIRFKLHAGSKAHARNISVRSYTAEPTPIIVRKTVMNGDKEEILVRLKAAELINSDLKAKLQKLQQEAK